jgi:hypothetical protein
MHRTLCFTSALFLTAALLLVACDQGSAIEVADSGGSGPGSTGGTGTGATGTGATGTGATDPGTGGVEGEGTGGTVGGGTAADCGAMTGSGNLTAQYDYARVSREGREYVIQNNVWGSTTASQVIQYKGTSLKILEQTGDNGTSGSPVSYPSIFIGSNNSRSTANSGLPKAVSSLTSVMTSFSHNGMGAGTIAGVYNTSYDVWFSTTSAGDAGSPSGGYLMVWLYDPPTKQPVGSSRWPNVTIPGVEGTWNVWLGTLGSTRPVISYVRTQPIASMTFDLNSFIQDAVNNRTGSIQAGWYLTNVFGGFEIWSGGTGLEVTCFYVEVS